MKAITKKQANKIESLLKNTYPNLEIEYSSDNLSLRFFIGKNHLISGIISDLRKYDFFVASVNYKQGLFLEFSINKQY